MNILVLGGNGYLGSKIIKLLCQRDGANIVLTRRKTSDMSRIEKIIGTENNIKAIPASIDAIEAAMEYDNFDIILNMACSYGRKNTLYNNVIEANIEFPLRVLNCAAEKQIKKFLTIGTGLPDELNMYSFSKKMFSDFGHYYALYHKIDFFNLRLEMFYGADEPGNRFIPCLIDKMIKGEDVNVTLGTQHRDIIAVEDIINAILIVIDSDLHGYHEISIGTGIAPTISELVDYIWEKTGKRSIIHKGAVPMRENEPDCKADISRISSLTDWNPIDWKSGINKMIDDRRKI
ncbi:MAG: NAD(P)-dependent oxidoreductase [Lachnospiraceae bacterium]|nr:NAD(P)-dependent oxidoreductase [Lachnospiraceae bacterium]